VGNLITVLLQISSRLRHWKNFENRPVFDEVMPKILLVHFFSGHSVEVLKRAQTSADASFSRIRNGLMDPDSDMDRHQM